MGVVFRAATRNFNAMCALKLLPDHFADDPGRLFTVPS
jgi:hypothetical protein